MAQSMMILATTSGTGKSAFSLGLYDQFERNGARARYFKPVGVGSNHGAIDADVRFVHQALHLPVPPEEMVAVSSAEVRAAIAAGRYEDILDRILEAHARLAESADVIICEGVDSMQAFPALESDINIDIARNINAATLLLTGARGRHAGAVIDDIRLVRKKLEERGAQVFGVVINRVDPTHHGDFADEARRLLKKEGLQLYGVLPEIMQLSSPRVADVVRELGAEVLVGEHHLETRFGRALVAAMGLENALHYMEESALVITPGDREEILLAAAAAHAAENVPRPSGVVLTGGFEPRRKVMQLVRALSGGRLPILRVDTPTYETTIAVSAIRSSLEEGQDDKALAIREAMEEYINVDALMQERFAPTERVLTPKRFLRDLRDKARADKKTIVLPEGNVDRILKATEALRRQDIANIVLVGDDGEVRKYAGQLGVTLDDGVEIVNPLTDAAFDDYVDTLVELRKHKGLPKDMAQDLMRDRNYFGTMMVHKGRADGLVSGSTTTTQATLRPAFEFVRAREGFKHVSSVFFMCLPDRVLVYADCAVIPNPTTEQLAEIALASAETAAAFGIEPRVAMLSYSTGASGKGEDVDTVRAATTLVRERNPTLKVEGPIQYDAAVDPGVARTKLPDSDVAGRATVFIFPDLNTGNNTYKAVQRTAGAIAIGPVLQGMRKPVNDLSRGATITDIVNTAIVTAIQAQAE